MKFQQRHAYIAAKVLNPEPVIKYFNSLNELYIHRNDVVELYIKGIHNLPEWIFKLKKNKIIDIKY